MKEATRSTTKDKYPLTEDQVNDWNNRKYFIDDKILDKKYIHRMRKLAEKIFPKKISPNSENRYFFDKKYPPFDDIEIGKFPVCDDGLEELNFLSLHLTLLNAAKQLLNTKNIRLNMSFLWARYGITNPEDDEKIIHLNYPNYTSTYPPRAPDAVQMMIYLDNTQQCGGATRLVPEIKNNDKHFKIHRPNIYQKWKNLYEREEQVSAQIGSVLFFRTDTWHRTMSINPGMRRMALSLTFHRADSKLTPPRMKGIASKTHTKNQVVERMIAAADIDQRNCLGFPDIDNSYWSEETLLATHRRYGHLGMDLTPYYKALNQRNKTQ